MSETALKDRVNNFVDLFPGFHSFDQIDQIVHLVFFHAVEERRESVNTSQLKSLFHMAGLPVPKNLPKLLAYLCGKGAKLLNNNGEFTLRREVKSEIEDEVNRRRGQTVAPPPIEGQSPFDFPNRTFSDNKIATLLSELRKCYAQECWNACGLLIRIIVERTMDAVDPSVKGKSGLRDKLNCARQITTLSKTLREAVDHLQGAKIFGDIAAHHSKILLDRPDINIVLPPFRVLLKEVTSV